MIINDAYTVEKLTLYTFYTHLHTPLYTRFT